MAGLQFPWLSGKNLPAQAGDTGSVLGWKIPREGHGNLSDRAWEIPDRGSLEATVHSIEKSWTPLTAEQMH